MAELITRTEQNPEYTWRTQDIYADSKAWEAELKKVEAMLARAGEYQAAFSQDTLLDTLKFTDEVGMLLERVYCYAHLIQNQDTAAPEGQQMLARAQNIASRTSAALAFLTPAIIALDEGFVRTQLEKSEFGPYKHMLESLLRQKEHTLPEREEWLLASLSEAAGALSNAFNMLEAADLKFENVGTEPLSHSKYQVYLRSNDRAVRKEAFEKYYAAFLDHKNTFAALYAGSVQKDLFYARARRYSGGMEASLDEYNVPEQVYARLIDTVREYLPHMHRYLELRRKLLKLDSIAMYDVYVPLVSELDWKIDYEEAKRMVVEAVQPMGEEFARELERGMDSGWVDVYENKGKTTGAYSMGVYGVHPFVLMNYNDTVDSAFTLAHEMGHSMHTFYAERSQPYASASYSLFTAEVASTFLEVLMLEDQLKETTDPLVRMYLLNHRLEQFRGTVFRQVMFAEFEREVHNLAMKDEPVTLEGMSGIYAALNLAYYGKDVEQDERIAHEWMRIPHFYRSFYVYQYATGYSAAEAMGQMVLSGGEEAARRVLGFMQEGGNDYPIEILKRAGIDFSTPAPVKAALDVFVRTLDEFEALALKA